MSGSPLSFANSSSFRNLLLGKNLPPYKVPGVYTPPSGPTTYEATQTYLNVVDSPNNLILDGTFSKKLYPLNEFGPNGGYNLNITYNGPPVPVNSNQGEYYPTETVLDLLNEFYIDSAYLENKYGPNGGFNDMVIITDIQNNNKIYQPYWDPPTFAPSSYSPYSILTSKNPTGDNGTLSQDSYLAKIGAEQLNFLFQKRVDSEIFRRTVGTVNLESLSDPFEASLIATGQEPLVYRDWRITVPENPILRGADFITRLGGAYWPVSPIPGNYFNQNIINGQSTQVSLALNVTNQLTGGFLGPILNLKRNPSQIFLANTGNGQKSVLFNNINYNRYRPSYDNAYSGLLGVASGIVNLTTALINPNGTLVGGYYVGSRNAEPSSITSPPNQIPVNQYGQQVETPVYGPSELGILYEGNKDVLNFGLAAKPLSDGGGIDGQFVWVSPKYKANAGFKATPGGGSGSLDSEFNQISSYYQRDESTNITFKSGSILDQTQRLINSADNVSGISRLKHTGNAINQVSKVFNDGYKELTKGSRVISYKDFTTGSEEGIEYCRIFTKDTPYYTYADLQKTDGITNAGRRFAYSVLDNTFNLNIAPTTTNIIKNNNRGLGGYAKKYMFSIENLAWRTSSRPGFTYDELPVCEKGPNGGRVMWFPPYDLKFNDSSTANWNSTSFLGRPEPIYTYKDTSRNGTLSWKIIVDHPSILNVIVDKHLKTNKEKMNSIVDSFFAGCTKYDIYQLALKYNTIPTSDLYTYQEILNKPNLTKEELENIKVSIPSENSAAVTTKNTDDPAKGNTNISVTNNTEKEKFESEFNKYSFYFHHDYPNPNSNSKVSTESYEKTFEKYKTKFFPSYQTKADSIFNPNSSYCKANPSYCSNNSKVNQFWDSIINDNFSKIDNETNGLVSSLYDLVKTQNATINIELIGSASASGDVNYNQNLSSRRIDSVRQYILYSQNKKLEPFKNKITINGTPLGEIATATVNIENNVTPVSSSNSSGREVICSQNVIDGSVSTPTKKQSTQNSEIYSVDAMACRRVRIKATVTTVTSQPDNTNTTVTNTSNNTNGNGASSKINEPIKTIDQTIQVPKPSQTKNISATLKEGIGKKILRQLLSECDYFEVIEKEVPMLYDSIKEKIKYFNPAFHSITPEGLNSRLTFLNQCVRPGETIPTIDSDGKPKYNVAKNTSFGTPPVLILRIGDFYHTKIIPKTMSITYEPLLYDTNPEGIGVQPMIANVTLGFDFIGGHGLAKPVEQLQNALSFNYYANTEIYDERATWTDDSFQKIDKELEKQILLTNPLIEKNVVVNTQQNAFGDTIGTIVQYNRTVSGETGEISYQTIMDNMLKLCPEYFTSVTNLLESVVLKYNYGILQLINQDRKYKLGKVYNQSVLEDVKIYGKPEIETTIYGVIKNKFTDLFNAAKIQIDDNTNPILKKLSNYNMKPNEENAIKTNMKNYLNEINTTFSNNVQTIITQLCTLQQSFVLELIKTQIINGGNSNVFGIDGKKTEKGTPLSYKITKTNNGTTFQDLKHDIGRIITYVGNVYNVLETNNIITKDYTSVGNIKTIGDLNIDISNKVFFMIVSRNFDNSNELENFKKYVMSKNITPSEKLKKYFYKAVDEVAAEYSKELRKEEKMFTNFKKSRDYTFYITGLDEVLYSKGKNRILNYTTVLDSTEKTSAEKILNGLFDEGNNAGTNYFIQDRENGKFNKKFN